MKKLLKKIMVTGVALASLFAFTGCPGAAPEEPETPEVPAVDQRTEFEETWPRLSGVYFPNFGSDYDVTIWIYKDGTYELWYTGDDGRSYKEYGNLFYTGKFLYKGNESDDFILSQQKAEVENENGNYEKINSAKYSGVDLYVRKNDRNQYRLYIVGLGYEIELI